MRLIIEKFIRTSILLLINIYLLILIITRDINEYVHPRIKVFIYIGICFLILMIITEMITNASSSRKIREYIPIGISILLILSIEINSIDIKEFYNLGVNDKNNTIISDNNFIDLCNNNLDVINLFIDKKIDVMGFYKKEGDNIYICRYLMTCCAADMNLLKIELKNLSLSNIEDGGWMLIKGDLKYQNEEVYINCTDCENIIEPTSPYIYY